MVLGGWAVTGMAVSLGRSQGAALVGRPLDISVQAVLDGSGGAADACLGADVFYADTRVENARIRVSLERTGSDQQALIRVRASAAVDEPVVTVLVRAGCGTVIEKRYVLLADPVPPQQASPATLSPPAASRERVSLPSIPASASPVLSDVKQGPLPARLRPPRPRGADTAAPVQAKAAVRAPPRSVARLTLEPLDLTLELPPQLKTSRDLLSLPAASAEQRAMAAAMWKALTAEPDDVLRDASKMNAMESELRRLGAESRTNRETLATLQGELQRQHDARVWIYACLAGLTLALLSAAYVWRRRRAGFGSGHPGAVWWRRKKPGEMNWFAQDTGAYGGDRADSFPADSDLLYLAPQDRAEERPRQASRPWQPVPAAAGSPLPPVSRRDRGDFALSMPHTPRAVKAEELFDVQHQAEFFISIGQPEQAVAVLRSHILEEAQTSPLVYLDLFSLYHQLRRREDFESLRVEFNRLFNADLPAFGSYSGTGPGLEAYQAALSRIVSLWPTPKVLEVIEESVFRKPGSQAEAFGLEAYRELLFLYGIAKEIVQTQPVAGESLLDFDLPSLPEGDPLGLADRRSARKVASQTALQPLSAASADDSEVAFPQLRTEVVLDIDLGALERDGLILTATRPAGEAAHPPKSPAPAPAALTDRFGDFNLIDFEVSGSSPPSPSSGATAVRPVKN